MTIEYKQDGTCDYCGKEVKWADISHDVRMCIEKYADRYESIFPVHCFCGCALVKRQSPQDLIDQLATP